MKAPDGEYYPLEVTGWRVDFGEQGPRSEYGYSASTGTLGRDQKFVMNLQEMYKHWMWILWVTLGGRPWMYQWEGDEAGEEGATYEFDVTGGKLTKVVSPLPSPPGVPTPPVFEVPVVPEAPTAALITSNPFFLLFSSVTGAARGLAPIKAGELEDYVSINGKFPKAKVLYIPVSPPPALWDYKCKKCRFWLPPNGCSVVEGEISPGGWCVIWLPPDTYKPLTWPQELVGGNW